MISPARRYLVLDAMRGLAALAVLWGHLMDSWGLRSLRGPQFFLAVDFFFMLSGFVVAHAYAARMKQGMTAVDLCRVRAIRLYPLMVMGALIGACAALIRYGWHPAYAPNLVAGDTAMAALGLPHVFIPVTRYAFPLNAPAWSLFFELAASFGYALIARRLTRTWTAALTVVGATLLIITAARHHSMDAGWQALALLDGAPRVIFAFFAGLLIYEFRPKTLMSPRVGWLALAVLLVPFLWTGKLDYRLQLAIVMLVFPALIWIGSAALEDRALARVGATLGALSYPLYILHWPFLDLTRDVFRKLDPHLGWLPLWVALQIALVVAVAWLAMRTVDEPVRAWLTRLSRKPRSKAPEAAPANAVAQPST
jgi:peptidoglycan/LPS O-acetylase OafA/YrhL